MWLNKVMLYYQAQQHDWSRTPTLNKEKFEKVVQDFKKVLPLFKEINISLAGGLGEGEPKVNNKEIWFNGSEKCGHTERDLGITWPSKNASGIGCVAAREPLQEGKLKNITQEDGTISVLVGNPLEWTKNSDVSGTWFAGAELNTRTCGGECDHETFIIERKFTAETWDHTEKGKYFQFCKTAYKPYDFAVCVALVIAKHHLNEQIEVSSDGLMKDWADAIAFVKTTLGYGEEFKLQ